MSVSLGNIMDLAYEINVAPGAPRRALQARHLQLMGMGSAIGAGFLLGTGRAIHDAGPGLLLVYLFAGAIVYLLMRALGELALTCPEEGSFSAYATRFLGPAYGFVAGWSYWLGIVLVVMAEVTGVGMLIRQLLPQVPQWLTALGAISVLYVINAQSARNFGEAEYWLALIKVLTLVAVVVVGCLFMMFGHGAPDQPTGMANLWRQGGFLANGFTGLMAAFAPVLFAFGGTEVPILAAPETSQPEKTLPKVLSGLVWRIALIYVAPLAVVMMIIPWSQIETVGSPFILVLQHVGLPNAARIVVLVAVTAIMSGGNGALFAGTRMLRSMALTGNAPRALAQLSGTGVPVRALTVCFGTVLLAVAANYLAPEKVLAEIMKVVAWLVLTYWLLIMETHMAMRRAIARGQVKAVQFQLRGGRYSSLVVCGACALAAVELVWFGSTERTFELLGGWCVMLYMGYRFMARRSASGGVS
jgi:L-asparagine transporter-like permease